MSLHFYKLAIKDIRRETPDCVSVLFDVPDELKESFKFNQGQSLVNLAAGLTSAAAGWIPWRHKDDGFETQKITAKRAIVNAASIGSGA